MIKRSMMFFAVLVICLLACSCSLKKDEGLRFELLPLQSNDAFLRDCRINKDYEMKDAVYSQFIVKDPLTTYTECKIMEKDLIEFAYGEASPYARILEVVDGEVRSVVIHLPSKDSEKDYINELKVRTSVLRF